MSLPIVSYWTVIDVKEEIKVERTILNSNIREHLEFVRRHNGQVVDGSLWTRNKDRVSQECEHGSEEHRFAMIREAISSGRYPA